MAVFDTSFIIDLLKGKIEAKEKLKELKYEAKFITTPSIMELWHGANISNLASQEKEKVLRLIHAFTVLNLDTDSALIAGEIEADLHKKGKMIETEDIQIGAISKNKKERLITKNKKHFERIKGLKIEEY